MLHMTLFTDVGSSGRGQCALEISLRGSPARSSWYDIWAAASAAATMCVRRQRIGVSSIICEMGLAGNGAWRDELIRCIVQGGSVISMILSRPKSPRLQAQNITALWIGSNTSSVEVG